jgi:hypothetical protein
VVIVGSVPRSAFSSATSHIVNLRIIANSLTKVKLNQTRVPYNPSAEFRMHHPRNVSSHYPTRMNKGLRKRCANFEPHQFGEVWRNSAKFDGSRNDALRK